jgi:UDP-N-acetylmuramyl pentapeptide phosphotransferase/UDP-N-acetylglucosamine-1-phosphate transferase
VSKKTVARAASMTLAAAAGAGAARLAYRRLREDPPGPEPKLWQRTNHRGEPVTLLEGPAVAVAAAATLAVVPGLPAGVRTAGVLAAAGAGACGVYDDLGGDRDRRGFRGHLSALAKGELTTGAVKILGIGAVGLVGGALVRRRPTDTIVDKTLAAVVIAGSANLTNLFDLRPGRAIKAAMLVGVPGALRGGPSGVVGAGVLGAAAGLLPEDLGERAMLGDTGANALGAVLGTAAAARASRRGLVWRALALTGMMAASEKISFTGPSRRRRPCARSTSSAAARRASSPTTPASPPTPPRPTWTPGRTLRRSPATPAPARRPTECGRPDDLARRHGTGRDSAGTARGPGVLRPGDGDRHD